MKQVKQGFSVKKQFIRGKRVVGMSGAIAGAYSNLHRIGAFKEPPREILPRYINAFCRKMAGAFDINVVHVEPIPQTHALWASNHLSWMDIPVIGSSVPCFFLSKDEISKWPVFGKLVVASGHLLIKRGSGDTGSVTSQITDFLNKGYSVMMFPEGTTTDGNRIKKVHGKLLQAAIDANIPIQPIVVCYGNKDGSLSDALPYYGNQTMKTSMKKVLDSRDVTAYILPLEAIEVNGKDQNEVRDILQDRLEKGLVELHSRVAAKTTMAGTKSEKITVPSKKMAA